MFTKTKRIISALAVIVAITGSVSAASLINKNYSNIQSIKLPSEVQLHKGEVKALFAGQNGVKLQEKLQAMGVLNSEVYQVLYKNQDVVKYGAAVDIHFGRYGLAALGSEEENASSFVKPRNTKNSLSTLADYINTSGNNTVAPYTVVTPLAAQKNGTYTGVLSTDNIVSSVPYREVLHVTLYDNKYYGTAARVVAVNAADDKLLWPSLEGLMKVK